MKKIYLIFILLILSACTPQVTVTSTVTSLPPTETPFPTPTLNPEYVELQNLFSDSSEHLIILPNGQIEENGVVIQNLQVGQNGEISILVEGENIVIDSADITFEGGFHINGYEFENDEWVEAKPSPEKVVMKEANEWNLIVDGEHYSIAHDVDGNAVLLDNKTKEIVLWNDGENNYWNLQTMREMIVESGDCKETRWQGVKGRGMPPNEDSEAFKKNFFYPFLDIVRAELGKMTYPHSAYTYDFLGGSRNCWATEPVQHVGQIADDLETTIIFWKDKEGRLQHEPVFNPRLKKLILTE